MRRLGFLLACLSVGLLIHTSAGDAGGRLTREQAAVKRTLRAAIGSALKGGNLPRACRFGTQKARERLIAGFSAFDQRTYKTCEEVLRAVIADESNRYIVRSMRRHIAIAHIRVRGRRARAAVGYDEGADHDAVTVTLRKLGGRWRIDNSDFIPRLDSCGCGA
jgi:hypothetical protein